MKDQYGHAYNNLRKKKCGGTAGGTSSLPYESFTKTLPRFGISRFPFLQIRSMRQRVQERAGGSFVAEHCKGVVQQFRAGRVLMTMEIMSAAILNIRWNDRTREQALPISHCGKI